VYEYVLCFYQTLYIGIYAVNINVYYVPTEVQQIRFSFLTDVWKKLLTWRICTDVVYWFLKKTFDSIQRSELFEIMLRMGIYVTIKTCTDNYEPY